MAGFSSQQQQQQPDEGYSEDPLNPGFGSSSNQDVVVSDAGTIARPPTDLDADIARYFSSLSTDDRLERILAVCNTLPTSDIAKIVKHLFPRLYIDFVCYLPPEVCLKILGYLAPVDLINVARACRAWHVLAIDRKLWEKAYRMEGWKAVYPEIRYWEEKVNENFKSSSGVLHKVRSSEDGHVSKKRAISEDNDLEMTDVDRTLKTEDSAASADFSIFGSPASSFTAFGRSSVTPQPGDVDMDRSASGSKSHSTDKFDVKGKGKASPLPRSGLAKEESLPPMIPAEAPGSIPQSTLWSLDTRGKRYRLNWKYLYTMRRRLERNWELGKYTNFQLPHPDHPEEGHRECIYSLQYDKEFLVSGSRDKTLRIWSLELCRLVRKPLEGHTGSVLCLQFDADPEEDLIVSGSSDSNVILWRFSTGQIIQVLKHAHSESVLNVKFDKRILVTCSKDKSIKIFNRKPLKYGDPGYGDAEIVYSAPAHLRDYGYINPRDELPVKPPYTIIGSLDGHGAAVNAVQICKNEVVSASGDRNIKVWDWAKQICIRTVVGHGKGIACVQYDGRRIVSGSSDNEVKVFDRATGLEVASLRAHQNLVRTVQAGFGDLPYSEEEDKAEAKRVDDNYFKAVADGLIENESSSRRGRPRNAGSSKPQDITAYGANLPPGGGGGKYARIVSGSYDQTIIIWRRDKEGVWKDAHHLRQEDAAATAQSQAQEAATASTQATAQAMMANMGRAPHARAAAAAEMSESFRNTIETPIIATITPQSTASFTAFIDMVVPQGPTCLRLALMTYPTMLAHEAHMQAAIAREVNPRTREELQNVVANALRDTQDAQARHRLSSTQASETGAASESRSPAARHSHGQSPPPGHANDPLSAMRARRQQIIAAANAGTPIPPRVHGGLHITGQHVQQQNAAAQQAQQAQQAQAQPTQPGAPVQTQATPVPAQGGGQAVPDAAAHHPHIEADHGPARVFKLQYDARRIICCSQTNVIVGWDFCNNDPELMDVARFFATVD
ncbi:F-box/WD repeat-containing protein lin-23 [Colletotrichum spinosum]|uniref:F-box/WD repeat-containing protein lin-23 n=1 Tax=Colletotrichum spinosum TaxID=1347390 RepID=A0A4R8QYV7_9PEZI|nr:F-box/WD repeat-containing protein lin-23 [Colletotrichum spinosum]